jgi:pimeloyl-ACP methyl ester carboxylesterase
MGPPRVDGAGAAADMTLNYERRGQGEPLLLVHGAGMHWPAWTPVLEALSAHRDVIAVDLPGHGRSPLDVSSQPLTVQWFARELCDFLDALGLNRVHVAGVSFGGWIALEFGKTGRALTVTALCPGGQWKADMPMYVRSSLTVTRWLTRRLKTPLTWIVRYRAGRTLVLSQMTARPWRIPPDEAADLVRAFAESPGYDQGYAGVKRDHFTNGHEVRAPVTIAYGERDRLMLRWLAQRRELAPPGARLLVLRGCGHVPLWDDPEEVTRVVLEGSSLEPSAT